MNKIIILLFLMFGASYSSDRILLGNIEKGVGLDSLPDWKTDAALFLISSLTDKFDYIDIKERELMEDSLKASAVSEPNNPQKLLKNLAIDRIALLRINRLENILGVTLYLKPMGDSVKEISGTGFANLNLRDISTDESVYDLALTFALQRSVANAYKDSTLFESAPQDYKTFPWHTLAIGGLEFINNEKLKKWSIFEEMVLNSYSLVENIWEASYNKSPFIIYDTATRDTLYTKFNMYGIENYDAPTKYEIDALSNFDINRYITGKLTRVAEGAEVKLYLCKVSQNGLEILETVEGTVEEDDMELLEQKVRELTIELLL